MTAFVQLQHIKLGLAGNERNWLYAAYELDQLRETLADVAEILPKYRDLSIPDMIERTSGCRELGNPNEGRQPVQCGQWTTSGGVRCLSPKLRLRADSYPVTDGTRVFGSGFPSAHQMIGRCYSVGAGFRPTAIPHRAANSC